MRLGRLAYGVFALAIALLLAPVVGAQTTVVDTQLGSTFTGTVDSGLGEVVQGRFSASGGETVTLTVQATAGSTLEPTAMIRDAGGAPLAGGFSRRIGWMGMGNLTHTFTVPTAGTYLAEIGGQSGSGGFNARLSGSPVVSNLVAVSGVLTDSLTMTPLSGATVEVAGNSFDTTDATGAYAGQLSPGTYNFVFSAAGYTTWTQSVTVTAGTPITDLDIALDPLVPVTTSTSASGDMDPGGVVMATVDVMTAAGVDVLSYTWTQTGGPSVASLTGADTATATATLADAIDFKAALVDRLSEPPITQDQLPPNVPLPHGDFPGGLQDRLQVVGINPFALEEAAIVTFEVEVVTDAGTFIDEVEIHAHLPWMVAPNLRNVPLLRPVLVQAKEHTSYDWTLNLPPGSSASLMDTTTRYPYFTPDVPGLYELVLASVVSGSDTLEVYAGTWRGTIVDQDMNGRPVGDTACTFCHDGSLAADTFTDWKETGHAEIFTDNLNTSPYWGTRCFSCHTVGYDTANANGGIDEAADYSGFLTTLGNPNADNWTNTLAQYPETARMANVQCENCHGPQDSFAHGFGGPFGEPRVDLSSDVCATCHGEPLRHARFQQWQLSAHANYELAIDEGSSGNCSRCHTANGFLEWLPVLLDDDPLTDPLASITVDWDLEDTHPQTCVACHDPHAPGSTSGNNSNATVRISGDTPPLIAGFTATGVGKGAICMTCHNTRRGLRNDTVWDTLSATEKARAPHGGAQADMLVGENAYFVTVGERGGHSYTQDACVSCHMKVTDPPADLAYNLGGANHTFFAERNICSDCHSPNLLPDDVQDAIQHLSGIVEDLIESAIYETIADAITAGNTIDLNGDIVVSDASLIAEIQFTSTRGRQAIEVTMTDTSVYGPHRLQDIDVIGATTVGLHTLTPDDLLKSGWNWLLVSNDGSKGVHNPFFANGVLIAARDALVQTFGAVNGPAMRGADSRARPEAPPWQDKVFESRRRRR